MGIALSIGLITASLSVGAPSHGGYPLPCSCSSSALCLPQFHGSLSLPDGSSRTAAKRRESRCSPELKPSRSTTPTLSLSTMRSSTASNTSVITPYAGATSCVGGNQRAPKHYAGFCWELEPRPSSSSKVCCTCLVSGLTVRINMDGE